MSEMRLPFGGHTEGRSSRIYSNGSGNG